MATARTIGWLLVVLSGGAAQAASPDVPVAAMSCSGCHATARDVETAVPRLYGRPAADIVAAMRDFRQGERAPTVMGRIAKGYTDAEVEALAAWFAARTDPP